MNEKRIKLGWFNAWVGLSWLAFFIPCFLFLFRYKSFLDLCYSETIVSKIEISFSHDRSIMKMQTDKGVFLSRHKDVFDTITEELKHTNDIKIWYHKKDRIIGEILIDTHFVFSRNSSLIIIYGIGLLFSGFTSIISILLIIRTKGWGSYDLLRKHPDGLFGYLHNNK